MRISVPKETRPGENRVALVPDIISKLTRAGLEVVIESGAGLSAQFSDEQYTKAGSEIIMYGVIVGTTQVDVSSGQWMNTSNVKHATSPYAWRNAKLEWQAPDVSAFAQRKFNGYHRKDGRVGTANYWLFIPTVFCEKRNMDVIREALHNELGYAVTEKYKSYTRSLVEAYNANHSFEGIDLQLTPISKKSRVFENIDGIKFLNHEGGCGGIRQDTGRNRLPE